MTYPYSSKMATICRRKLTSVFLIFNPYENLFFPSLKKLTTMDEELHENTFVSVYEEEFKSFYDRYFSQYKVNKQGLLVIKTISPMTKSYGIRLINNDPLPLTASAFIYWVLTTDTINGLIDEEDRVFEVTDSNLIRCGNLRRKLDIDDKYSLIEQVQKIDDVINTLKNVRFEFKIYGPSNNYILAKFIEYELIIKMPEGYSGRLVYDVYKSLIQKKKTYFSTKLSDKEIGKNKVYQVYQTSNFVVIVGSIDYEYADEDEDKYNYVYNVVIYPVNYYYRHSSISQELDILNGYCVP